MKPDHPRYWKAVGAAVVDEERAAWTPHQDEKGRWSRPHESFTRAHVQFLRECGADDTDILDYAAQFLAPMQVAKLAGALGSM